MAKPIYRAPMRPRDRDDVPGAGTEHGLRHGIVGIGEPGDAKAARASQRFADLPTGTLVWSRDTAGRFHVGRISGPARRDDSSEAQRVGIRIVRPTHWKSRSYALPEIPPAVAATFARGGRNFQRVHDPDAERRTAELWAS